MADTSTEFLAYHYQPSLPLGVVFTCLFAVSTILHTYQVSRTGSMYMIPLVVGGLLETVGFLGRLVSSTEDYLPFVSTY